MRTNYLIAFGFVTIVLPALVSSQECVESENIENACSGTPHGYLHICDTCTEYIWCVHGNPIIQVCNGGTFWNLNPPGCGMTSNSCKAPVCGQFTVNNGKSEGAGDNNRQGKYTCDAGFMPRISGFVLECPKDLFNKEWIEPPSVLCIPVSECGSLPKVNNGGYEMENAQSTTAKARCNDGSKPTEGTPDIECVNGQWVDATDDFCIRGCVQSCIGEADGNYASCKTKEEYVTCVHELTYEMPCGATQHWDDEKRKCDVIQNVCNSVPEADNGFFEQNGDSAELTCNSGFVPRTAGYKVYCVDGQWDLPTPAQDFCIPDVTCGEPPRETNGWFEQQEDTTATLQCAEGYSSNGVITIECVDGEWPPITDELCLKDEASCGEPPEVENGAFVRDDDNANSATLQCDENHRPAQNYTIECRDDGTWPPVPDNICIPEFNSTAKGKTFVVAWFEKFNKYITGGTGTSISIYMTSSKEANVNISSYKDLGNIPTSYTFTGTKMIGLNADTFLQIGRGPTKSMKVVRINSDVDINVYSYNDQPITATANILHPVDSLGVEYILVSGPENPSYALVGLHNYTKYDITYPDGTKNTSVLLADMVYYVNMPGLFNLTGTYIKSDKPIAVFSGNKCTKVPARVPACDTLIEQLPTIASLQYVYVLSYMYPRRSFRLHIIVPHDNTDIEIGNSSNPDAMMMTKNKGEDLILDLDNMDTIYVKGSKPIMVAKYSHGNEYDNVSVGDPSLLIMPGIGQFESEYFYTSIGSFDYEKVYIIIPKKDRDGLRLNGSPVEPKEDNPEEISIHVPLYGEYCVVYFDVGKGTQHLTHVEEKQFGAVQYGAAMYVQYGYSLGYKMRSNAP